VKPLGRFHDDHFNARATPEAREGARISANRRGLVRVAAAGARGSATRRALALAARRTGCAPERLRSAHRRALDVASEVVPFRSLVASVVATTLLRSAAGRCSSALESSAPSLRLAPSAHDEAIGS
jgi:hypothetical protein